MKSEKYHTVGTVIQNHGSCIEPRVIYIYPLLYCGSNMLIILKIYI